MEKRTYMVFITGPLNLIIDHLYSVLDEFDYFETPDLSHVRTTVGRYISNHPILDKDRPSDWNADIIEL